jgi:hypothetical protein
MDAIRNKLKVMPIFTLNTAKIIAKHDHPNTETQHDFPQKDISPLPK